MHTLTIETDDQAAIDKIRKFLNDLKSEGVRVISKDNVLPISKNVPNAETIASFNETDLETMPMDEFSKLCR